VVELAPRSPSTPRGLGRNHANGPTGEIRDHANRQSEARIIVVWIVRDHRQAPDGQKEAESHQG
jgi:hypothetical protein